MTEAAQERINWRREFDQQTDFWQRHCKARWQRAEQLIEAGYRIVILPPLEKRTLPRSVGLGIHNPITNVKTLRTYTHPGSEYFDGNYGIVAGLGTCTVIDLDQGEERPGADSLIDMESKFSFFIPRKCIVNTPAGGQHIYLAYADNVAPRIRPFGQAIGIDIINSNGDKASRHVVGPGSVTERGEYTEHPQFPLVSVSLLAEYEMPAEFKRLMPAPGNNVVDMAGKPVFAKGNRGNEGVGVGDEYGKMSLADLTELLEKIPVKDLSFDEWLRVGMALHHDRGEDGKELWNEWSAGDPDRYDIRAIHSHWDTFDGDRVNGVTIGTAINLAQRYGYRVKPAQHVVSILDSIQAATPNIFMGGQCKFLRVTDDGDLHDMSVEDAKYWYANQEVLINNKPVNPITLFMRWPGRIKYDRCELLPPPAYCPPTTYNVWRGFRAEPAKGDTSRYMELFDSMIEPDIREWVHDWFADLVQNPGVKPSTCLVFQGPEGTGKNMLVDVFRRMFLEYNTAQFVSTDAFATKFNKFLLRSVLCVVNEAVWAGNHKHSAMLKGYITEERFEVQDKNIKGFQARNVTRFVIMSNEDLAVLADGDARRFCVCRVDKTRDVGGEWWKQTKAVLEKPETVSAVMHFYATRKITNDLHKAPQTEALADQKRHTKAKLRPNDKVFVDTILHLLRKGQAVTRVLDNGDRHHLISSNMIKQAYFAVTGKNPGDSWIWTLKLWMDSNLSRNAHIATGVKTKHGGAQRQASVWPDVAVMAAAMAKFELVDVASVDCPEEWSSDGISW
jgi:hypothetical protein